MYAILVSVYFGHLKSKIKIKTLFTVRVDSLKHPHNATSTRLMIAHRHHMTSKMSCPKCENFYLVFELQ